jgi:hypothetical protein
VLYEQLREEWHTRERNMPIGAAMTFTRDGLVLGAGTVLVPAESLCGLKSLKGQERRILALLSAAHGNAVSPSVLGNIERAGRAWSKGDDCLAYIHLAHARLQARDDTRSAACRLFIADRVMSAGVSPRTIFQALKIGNSYIDTVEKTYNPDEPRIPAGSGMTSGEWTDGDEAGGNDVPTGKTTGEEAQESSVLARMPLPASSFLGELSAAQLAELGAYALRLLGPAGAAAAAFGLLFIPSPNDIHVEGEVSGVPGLRYSWNCDEALLHFTYDTGDGEQRTFAASVDGDKLYDEQGRVIGRVLPDGGILIESAVASPDLANNDEPRLCPVPGRDKPNERGRAYENYVKPFVNPPPQTTPSGIGFQLPNPEAAGKLVYYDDCQLTTGMLVDAKGPGYDGLLAASKSTPVPEWSSVVQEWWEESGRQVAASGGRPVRWYFAELPVALFARQMFDNDTDGGRQSIEVVFLPWSKGKR